MSRGPKPRGVAGRNAGLKWILSNVSGDGVMYFADDDNTYDLRLFTEVSFLDYRKEYTIGITRYHSYQYLVWLMKTFLGR